MRERRTHATHGRWPALVAGVIAGYLKLVRRTARVDRVGVPASPRGATVYAALHGDQLALVGAHPPGFATLASHSRDGELAASVVRSLGHVVVRGSSSRGGAAGLLGLRRVLRRGRAALLTVDGPRGPAGVAGAGAAVLARAAVASLVPVVAECRPSLRLRSWDRLQIPLPFATVTVRYGAPIDLDGPRDVLAERTARSLLRLRAVP